MLHLQYVSQYALRNSVKVMELTSSVQSRAEAIPDHSFTDTTTDISSTTGLWSGDSFGFLSQDFGLFLQDNNFDFLNL